MSESPITRKELCWGLVVNISCTLLVMLLLCCMARADIGDWMCYILMIGIVWFGTLSVMLGIRELKRLKR